MRVMTAGFALVLVLLDMGISAASSANEARLSARWDETVMAQTHAVAEKTEARHLQTRSDAAATSGSGGHDPSGGSGRKLGVPGRDGRGKKPRKPGLRNPSGFNKHGVRYKKPGIPSGTPTAIRQGLRRRLGSKQAQQATEGSSQLSGPSFMPFSATQLVSRMPTGLPSSQTSFPPLPPFSSRTQAPTSVFQQQQHRPSTSAVQPTPQTPPLPAVPRPSESTGFKLFGVHISTQSTPPSPKSGSHYPHSRSQSPK